MSAPVIVQGMLKPDGTLELDQKPNLPPGPVLVSVQPVPGATTPQRTLVDVMDEIRQRQLSRGYQGRSMQEMQADEASRREEDEEYEQRMQALQSQTGPAQGKP